MDFWTIGSLAYVGVRTGAAVTLLVLAARRHVGAGALAGQALSDAIAALLLIAYAQHAVRDALGWGAVLLAVYFVAWEGVAALSRYALLGDSPVASPSDAELIGSGFRLTWEVAAIGPAAVAGGFLLYNVIVPNEWTFPNAPPRLACAPAVVAPDDTLTLRMRVPHGGELGVMTPRRGYLYFALLPPSGTVPVEQRFEYRKRLSLAVATATARRGYGAAEAAVFVDTGTYVFGLSEYRDPSVHANCGVRFLGRRGS